MKNKNIWVMIANTEKAYIYSITYEETKFKLIKKLTHKESRLKKQDLVSDRPGHYVRSCNKSRGSYAETTDPIAKFIKYHIAKDYIGAQKRILQSKWAPDLYHKIRLIFLSNQ